MAGKYKAFMSGKGDRYRPVDRKKWDAAWERIDKRKRKIENGRTGKENLEETRV